MGMNIKNERVHDLARQAATVTGLSQTAAVEEGLRLLLAQSDSAPDERARKIDLIRSISRAWDPGPPREGATTEVEDLYDSETGLPA